MSCKSSSKHIVKQILLYIDDKIQFIYKNCTNTRLTKRFVTLIYEYFMALQEENDEKIDRLAGQTKIILDYLDQSEVYPFIDLEYEEEEEKQNELIKVNNTKEILDKEEKDKDKEKDKEKENNKEETTDEVNAKIRSWILQKDFKPSYYIYYGDNPVLEIELKCGCVKYIYLTDFDIY